jgi:imidazole glycerol-phosphate synthase subunit HisH
MIAVIDLSLGNVGSVANMIKKAGERAEIVADPAHLKKYDRLVLPGVGAFDKGMERMESLGWIPALEERVIQARTPILGICLGLQLFCRKSEEGVRSGLGWLDAQVIRLSPSKNSGLKVPQMGWNEVCVVQKEPLFADACEFRKYYFLHSYHVRPNNAALILATASYGGEFVCAAGRGNILGVQFHPEKSHQHGLRLFQNFLAAKF